MKIISRNCFFIVVLLFVLGIIHVQGANVTCVSRRSPCFAKKLTCPAQCPTTTPANPKAKVCYINCNSPICRAECKRISFSFEFLFVHSVTFLIFWFGKKISLDFHSRKIIMWTKCFFFLRL